ncbi:hypothetical protein EJB05_48918, partial [Eragrostis curvula]
MLASTSGVVVEEAAQLWAELPVHVDWAAVAAQCAWLWAQVRAFVLVPAIWLLVVVSLTLTVMIMVEKLFILAVFIVVKVFRLRPERRYRWEPIAGAGEDDEEEAGNSAKYPMVLVQIPMYNEREFIITPSVVLKVYKLSIGATCKLNWPSDRFVIQVLDDSTDPEVKDMVKLEVQRWQSKGVNIKYEIRADRKGYKAGALKHGMKHEYVKECEYIAMFDADFQPESDFLLRTIPFLVHNPELALVQARWRFVNSDECLLTRFQEMSMDYHFKFEQEAGSSAYKFFGFNGTAGVWRISAIEDVGGWKDRTTVEDMDLAVRSTLQGWKFVYVGDIQVKSELPSTFKAYRFQQHRWSCGPANLLRKMIPEVAQSTKISWWGKLHLWYDFFIIGKVACHTVTFIYYCFAIPVSVLLPEIQIPLWGVVYVPSIITFLKALGSPSSFHLVILWVLFENVMSLHRLTSSVSGLLDLGGRVNEWVVTEKLGGGNKTNPNTTTSDVVKVIDVKVIEPDVTLTEPLVQKLVKKRTRLWDRFNFSELLVGICMVLCGCYDVLYAKKGYHIYLFLQGMAFLVVGFGYIGILPPRS